MKLGRGQQQGVPFHMWWLEKPLLTQRWEWARWALREEHSKVGTLDMPDLFKQQEGGQWG